MNNESTRSNPFNDSNQPQKRRRYVITPKKKRIQSQSNKLNEQQRRQTTVSTPPHTARQYISTRPSTVQNLQQTVTPRRPTITAAVHKPTPQRPLSAYPRRPPPLQRGINYPLPPRVLSPFNETSNEHDASSHFMESQISDSTPFSSHSNRENIINEPHRENLFPENQPTSNRASSVPSTHPSTRRRHGFFGSNDRRQYTSNHSSFSINASTNVLSQDTPTSSYSASSDTSTSNPAPIRRHKTRKKKQIADRIETLLKTIRIKIGNFSLCNVITIDSNEMKWWYCNTCTKRYKERKYSKSVTVRDITIHLKSKRHHESLPDHLKAANEKRMESEKLEKQKVQSDIQKFTMFNVNRNAEILNQHQSIPSNETLQCDYEFTFFDDNQWHQNILKALDSMELRHNLSVKQMAMINYFNSVHDDVTALSSLSQIEKSLLREQKHGAVVPKQYASRPSIMDAIKCLAAAQREFDMQLITRIPRISIAEDGNKLHGMAARGYMVRVIDGYAMKEIFIDLKDPKKSTDADWKELETIDTGKDTFDSMKNFVECDLNKRTTDIVSICTDWSGTNAGSEKGARAYWAQIAPYCLWNWDDEHRLARISGKLKEFSEYQIIHEILKTIRDCLFNSSISVQRYQKFLALLNEKLIIYARDIDIRFNSILPVLQHILNDYILVLKYVTLESTLNKECIKYPQLLNQYKIRMRAFREAQVQNVEAQNLNAMTSNENQARHLLAQASNSTQRNQSKPVPPPIPRIMNIRNVLNSAIFLLQMSLLRDYIDLFHSHSIKTGSVEFIKCLVIEELDALTINLMKWKKQNVSNPKSPMFSSVLAAMTKNENQWIYTAPGGHYHFEVNLLKLQNLVNTLNKLLNAKMSETLKCYYSEEERIFMRCQLELVDPQPLNGIGGEMLKNHGMLSLKCILRFYAKSKNVNGLDFQPILSGKQCIAEYKDWKEFAVLEAGKVVGLSSRFDQIMALYRLTYVKFKDQYPIWFLLYELILLNWGSSMSLERLYRLRKLLQPAECSNYQYEGLSDRLVLCHNSATAGSMESVKLYIKAMEKWNAMTKTRPRQYFAIPPTLDSRLCL